jgi:DNA-directed RNA polymerase specialized sigma24 family protein
VTSTFPATRWSIVAAAATGDPATAHTALGELFRAYWYPLYAYARRKGLGPEDAEDATQNFLLTVVESKLFASADPSLGRLRTFLLTAFSRALSNARRAAARQKRGGGVEFVAFDFAEAEDRFQTAPNGDDPAVRFESDWAVALLDATMSRVEADYAASNRTALFLALRPLLGTTTDDPPDHAALASALGMSRGALRQSLARFRDRFRTTLRTQIADTLREPTDRAIDEELHALRAVLAAA